MVIIRSVKATLSMVRISSQYGSRRLAPVRCCRQDIKVCFIAVLCHHTHVQSGMQKKSVSEQV